MKKLLTISLFISMALSAAGSAIDSATGALSCLHAESKAMLAVNKNTCRSRAVVFMRFPFFAIGLTIQETHDEWWLKDISTFGRA